MNFPTQRIHRFWRDESGVVMTEFLILLPLLLWCFMALFVYWDAFRTINEGQKASYAVADLISRQATIDRNFIGGMDDVIAYLLALPVERVKVRVTSIQWDETTKKHRRLFSESAGNKMPKVTEEQLNSDAYRKRIPTMADGDTAVIVETDIAYRPPIYIEDGSYRNAYGDIRDYVLSLRIPAQSFGSFIVTRPRNFRICLTEDPCSAKL